MKLLLKRCVLCVGLAIALGGCDSLAPMQSPPQLSATSGAPFTITQNQYTTTAFTTWIPSDWRVVSSPASAQPHVYLISPDEIAVIAVAVVADDIQDVLPPSVDGEIRQTWVTADALSVLMVATDEGVTRYEAIFQRVVESLVP
jgi:hypothetical protein